MSQSNLYDWALCVHCNKQMSIKQMLTHVCPDKPLNLVLTAKGKRLMSKKRRH